MKPKYKLDPVHVETKTERVQLVLQPSVLKAVRKYAFKNKTSINETFNIAIKEFMEIEKCEKVEKQEDKNIENKEFDFDELIADWRKTMEEQKKEEEKKILEKRSLEQWIDKETKKFIKDIENGKLYTAIDTNMNRYYIIEKDGYEVFSTKNK